MNETKKSLSSGLSVKNLKNPNALALFQNLEKDKRAQKLLPEIIKKPWGHERIIQKNDLYVVKELYVKPNSRLSLQYHRQKTETMFLVHGEGHLDFMVGFDHKSDLAQHGHWSSQAMVPHFPYHIQSGTVHRLYTKDEDCLVVEVSTTELDDVVRMSDDYGRTNG